MSKVTERIVCNLCGLQENEELYKDNRFRVVICSNCSLVFLNPRMTEEAYKTYYLEDYQKDRHKIATVKEATQRLEKKNSYGKKLKRFEFIEQYVSKQSKVLEIGAGMGTQLKVIKDKVGCLVEGIEISSLGAMVANDYYHIHVKNSTLEDFRALTKNRTYSFIILHHVLEHFLSPTISLNTIRELTDSKGKLYIAVPNMSHPDEPLDRFFRLPHTYYFTITTLTELLRKVGWEITQKDIGKQEIRVIAEKTEPKIETFINKEEVETIKRIVLEEEKKYYVLRSMKGLAEKKLPRSVVRIVRSFTIKVLRKLGIITV